MKLNNIKTFENWLNKATSAIEGTVSAGEYKNYIIPLAFLKRLSDILEKSTIKFSIPEKAKWDNIKSQHKKIGEYLNIAILELIKENPELNNTINIADFTTIDDYKLKRLIEVLSKYSLDTEDTEPDILGRIYEYLIKKTQNSNEFYTPKEVGTLMAKILDPKEGDEIYDPSCGSGGLLIEAYVRFKEKYQNQKNVKPIHIYGQEINHTPYLIAKMNAFIFGIKNAKISLGDTIRDPAFKEKEKTLKKFDLIIANPPWNQSLPEDIYINDPYNRFNFGAAPYNTADWGWMQHLIASLKENGKIAVNLDAGSISRNNEKEKNIRKQFIDNDLIESIITLPSNLFYNTGTSSVIIVINKNKKRKNEILLINASSLYKREGRINKLTNEAIDQIYETYKNWKEEEGFSKIVNKEEIVKNNYDLNLSKYINANKSKHLTKNEEEKIFDIKEIINECLKITEESKKTNKELMSVLSTIGLTYQ
jgi:type I restriction enzyme M protein